MPELPQNLNTEKSRKLVMDALQEAQDNLDRRSLSEVLHDERMQSYEEDLQFFKKVEKIKTEMEDKAGISLHDYVEGNIARNKYFRRLVLDFREKRRERVMVWVIILLALGFLVYASILRPDCRGKNKHDCLTELKNNRI